MFERMYQFWNVNNDGSKTHTTIQFDNLRKSTIVTSAGIAKH